MQIRISLPLEPFYRSLFIHDAPIRFPNTSSSLIQKLQTLKNSAQREAISCVKITSIDHLPEETKVLPVHDYLSLLYSKYLARNLQSIKPSQNIVASSSGVRNMKHTLQSLFRHRVSTYLQNDVLRTTSSKTASKSLHNVTILQSILFLAPKHVRQTSSSQISTEEVNLSLPCMTSHFQLRSSFCSSLLSYHGRIGLIPSPLYPS